MAVAFADSEPEVVVAGTTAKWQRSPADFPTGAGWTLTYFLRGESGLDVVGIENGANYEFTVSKTESAAFSAGRYSWELFADDGTERHAVRKGQFDVEADPSSFPAGHDPRSAARRTLAALEALIVGKASRDQKQMLVADRQITRLSPKELTEWLEFYKGEVGKEDAAAAATLGASSGKKILSRFPRRA